MDHKTNAIEAVASAASSGAAAWASKVTQVGAWSAIGSAILTSEFGMLMGLAIGLAGLFINWYYRRKEYQLRLAEFEHRKGQDKGA